MWYHFRWHVKGKLTVHSHQKSPGTEDQDIHYQNTIAPTNYIHCQGLVTELGHNQITHSVKYSKQWRNTWCKAQTSHTQYNVQRSQNNAIKIFDNVCPNNNFFNSLNFPCRKCNLPIPVSVGILAIYSSYKTIR